MRGGAASWTVRDVTNIGPQPPVPDRLVHSATISVAGRVWQFDVTPTLSSPLLTDRFRTHWIMVAGLMFGVMAGAAAYSFSRRAEAMRRVEALTDVLNAKDQFIASVSHELRTPLTGVLGFAEVLRDHTAELTPEERTELATAIADEASDLTNIIDDLLVMSRAEHGTLTVVSVSVDLRAQTAQVLEAMNLTDQIPLEVIRPAARAVADPGRVRQIIRNLLTNAVAYGGPDIRVVIEPVDEMLAMSVIDDGTGVPPGQEDKIFAPYHRAHATVGKPGSIGLGLSVSRTLAHSMGGDLAHRQANGETSFQLNR